MKFLGWLFLEAVGMFIIWCIVALLYFIIGLMFGFEFSSAAVWGITITIGVIDLLVGIGKHLD